MELTARWIKHTLTKHRLDTVPIPLMGSVLVVFCLVLNSMVNSRQEPHFFLAGCCALILNSFLVKTRWSAPWLILYNLIFSLFCGLQFSGKVFSLPQDGLFTSWLTQANLNLFLWIEYFNTWIRYVFQGRLFQDVNIFPLFLFVQVWFSTAWLWLGYKRQRSGLWIFLPIGVLITFWVQYKGFSPSFIVAAFFAGFVLVMTVFYQKQQRHWETTGLDYPSELWVEWAVTAVFLLIFVLAVARAAPLVTTQEGWQKINHWVDTLRPQQEQAIGSGGPVAQNNQTVEQSAQEEQIFNTANLETIGVPLEPSDETVMRVRVNGPTNFHWRNQIYSTYTGRGWEAAPQYQDVLVSDQRPLNFIRYRQEFMLNRDADGHLFAAGDPFVSSSEGITIEGVGIKPQDIPSGASTLISGNSRHYQVESWLPDLRSINQNAVSAQTPEEIKFLYLQLPENLPQRVIDLGEKITQGADNPLTAAVLVQNYLRETIPYDLNTPPPPAGRDVVDYFLFEAPSGFCTYYASAMTVLLRSQGIPARVVSGYAQGNFDPQSQLYSIPASNAHAWVEVFLPGLGWIPFEPTSSQTAPSYQVSQTVEEKEISALTPQQWLNRRRWWMVFFGILGTTIAGLLTWGFWKLFKLRKRFYRPAVHPVIRMYERFIYQLHLSGINQPTGQTPREFLGINQHLSFTHPALWSGFRQLTALYEQTVYSPHTPELNEVSTITTALRRSLWDWLRLWIVYRWQCIKEKLRR